MSTEEPAFDPERALAVLNDFGRPKDLFALETLRAIRDEAAFRTV